MSLREDVTLKACACLVDARGRLLVFHHPGDRGMQLPKGTVEPGELPQDAVRRELLEESGIRYTGALQDLGTMDRHCDAGIEGNASGASADLAPLPDAQRRAAARALRPRRHGQPRRGRPGLLVLAGSRPRMR